MTGPVQEELVDDSIRVFSDFPGLRLLIHAMASEAARHKLRLPAWISFNIVIAHSATLCSALYDSARLRV